MFFFLYLIFFPLFFFLGELQEYDNLNVGSKWHFRSSSLKPIGVILSLFSAAAVVVSIIYYCYLDAPSCFSVLHVHKRYICCAAQGEKYQLKMILIGLTGGIACGKSSVSKLLTEEHHIEIIDADAIVRELQAPHAACTRLIAARWPHCVDPVTGELNRPELGKLVFSDAQARKELGKIMNPAIFRAIMKRIVAAWWRDLRLIGTSHLPTVVVLDAPTLFETKTFTYFVSNSVVVSCSAERQIERLRRRNNFSEEQARQRIQSQMPLSVKRSLAGYVIENDHVDNFDALRISVQACVDWMVQQSNVRLTCIFGGAAAASLGVVAAVCYFGVKLFLY